MTKKLYLQPSVEATEFVMAQTLCASAGGGGGSYTPMSTINVSATTDTQL